MPTPKMAARIGRLIASREPNAMKRITIAASSPISSVGPIGACTARASGKARPERLECGHGVGPSAAEVVAVRVADDGADEVHCDEPDDPHRNDETAPAITPIGGSREHLRAPMDCQREPAAVHSRA